MRIGRFVAFAAILKSLLDKDEGLDLEGRQWRLQVAQRTSYVLYLLLQFPLFMSPSLSYYTHSSSTLLILSFILQLLPFALAISLPVCKAELDRCPYAYWW